MHTIVFLAQSLAFGGLLFLASVGVVAIISVYTDQG